MHCLSIILFAALCGFVYSSQTACYSNGKYYTVGKRFKKDCNWCTCGENGTAACTKMGCLKKREKRTSVPYIEGKCYFNGEFYDDGDTFNDSYGCNNCSCSISQTGEQRVHCTYMACDTLEENK